MGHDTTVAVIGGGNMGAALVGGLLRGGVAPSDVIIVETLTSRRGELTAQFPGVQVVAEVPRVGAVIVAVKPADVHAACVAAKAAGGFDADTSAKLIAQLFAGSSALLAREPHAAKELRARVTSPNGTTAAGVAVLDRERVRDAIVAAVLAARKRSTPFSVRESGTTPGKSNAGSIASPRSLKATPLQRCAAAGAKMSRPANVAPGAAR
ncbi:MAG: hypothetical protein EB104_04355 [Acidimicrobiia bacterium]|nr:hypothetical protein [Acidimicrobiia bacterium]